jgi:hypothetical protein
MPGYLHHSPSRKKPRYATSRAIGKKIVSFTSRKKEQVHDEFVDAEYLDTKLKLAQFFPDAGLGHVPMTEVDSNDWEGGVGEDEGEHYVEGIELDDIPERSGLFDYRGILVGLVGSAGVEDSTVARLVKYMNPQLQEPTHYQEALARTFENWGRFIKAHTGSLALQPLTPEKPVCNCVKTEWHCPAISLNGIVFRVLLNW